MTRFLLSRLALLLPTLLGLSGDEQGPHLHLGLNGGFSPLGLNLTQILEREGFDLNAFPGFSGITMVPEAAALEAPPMTLTAPVVIDKWLPTPKWNANRFDPDGRMNPGALLEEDGR